MDGIINLDKPAGMTSRRAVDAVRKAFPPGVKAGHAGTLDPAATGVLPVCLGKATRIVEYLMEHRKGYRAAVQLGVTTDTGDAGGQILGQHPVPALRREELEEVCRSLTGPLRQKPPAYAALKYRGKPYYYWARRGIEIEREPRLIKVYRFALLHYRPGGNPHLVCEVECSRGTYIRSLAAELGRCLGCGAHLLSLVRLFVGPFTLEEAVSPEEVAAAAARAEVESIVWPMDRALPHFGAVTATWEAVEALRQGRAVSLERLLPVEEWVTAGPLPVRVYDPAGRFRALAAWHRSETKAVLKTEKFLIL